jgi:hypothetical protein
MELSRGAAPLSLSVLCERGQEPTQANDMANNQLTAPINKPARGSVHGSRIGKFINGVHSPAPQGKAAPWQCHSRIARNDRSLQLPAPQPACRERLFGGWCVQPHGHMTADRELATPLQCRLRVERNAVVGYPDTFLIAPPSDDVLICWCIAARPDLQLPCRVQQFPTTDPPQ